jgi:hypothetical protein
MWSTFDDIGQIGAVRMAERRSIWVLVATSPRVIAGLQLPRPSKGVCGVRECEIHARRIESLANLSQGYRLCRVDSSPCSLSPSFPPLAVPPSLSPNTVRMSVIGNACVWAYACVELVGFSQLRSAR